MTREISIGKPKCSAACYAMPECTTCGKTKPPRGRDVPAAMAGSYCAHECPGHIAEPYAGHLWPGEEPTWP